MKCDIVILLEKQKSLIGFERAKSFRAFSMNSFGVQVGRNRFGGGANSPIFLCLWDSPSLAGMEETCYRSTIGSGNRFVICRFRVRHACLLRNVGSFGTKTTAAVIKRTVNLLGLISEVLCGSSRWQAKRKTEYIQRKNRASCFARL